MADVELPNPEEIEELKSKTFTRRVALTTAIYAVVLAIASLGGSNATKDMMLAQQKAADLWAHYQAKSIREHQSQGERARLELEVLERGSTMKPEVRQQFESRQKELAAEEGRYHREKEQLQEEAKKEEHERNLSLARDPYFDYGEVLLQIAIVMSSVAILASSRH